MKNSTAEERREFVGELIVGLVGAKGFDKLSKGAKIGDVIGGGKKLVKGSLEWIKEKTRLRKLNFKPISIKGTTKVRSIGKFGSEVRLNGREKVTMIKISQMSATRSRWLKGEEFWRAKLYSDKKKFLLQDGTNRRRDVDVWVEDQKLAIEVKSYFGKTKVSPNSKNPYGAENQLIKDEILRDEALASGGRYNPIWIFNGNGPNEALIKILEEKGIQWIQIIE